MSVFDKVVAALTPPETDAQRADARAAAENMAAPGDWLSMVLDHHRQIESAFDAVRDAGPGERRAAQKELAVILTGHSIAEESVLYPVLAEENSLGGAAMAYQEQAMAKAQMAMLEQLDPATQDYLDKLEHIRGAVQHHVFEEESTWFPRLKQDALQADQMTLTQRYQEEFERYTGGRSGGSTASGGMDDRMNDGTGGYAQTGAQMPGGQAQGGLGVSPSMDTRTTPAGLTSGTY